MKPSLQPWNPNLGRTQPRVLRLRYEITAAKTVKECVPSGVALVSFDTITQAQIDAHLGSEDEFDGDDFDATAMGADCFAGIVNLAGQCEQLIGMTARCYSDTAGGTLVEQKVLNGDFTASTIETAAYKSDDGNVAFKVNFGNTPDFDALTSGVIEIDLELISK